MTTTSPRAFAAWCADADSHRSAFRTQAGSFEEAAQAYVERWSGEGEVCRMIIVEEETGERHAFTVHL